MDTKTRRDDALALLALDTPDINQRNRLLKLTAMAAGYSVTRDDPGYLLLDRNGREVSGVGHGTEGAAWQDAPDVLTSVDACLLLPLINNCFWLLETKTTGVERADPYRATIYRAYEVMDKQQRFTSDNALSLAMIKAWWTLQD